MSPNKHVELVGHLNHIDHIVIACANLEQAAHYCQSCFGVSPQTGGKHALMSTHNLLLGLHSPAHAFAYLEFIAIDPAAPAVPHRRWFGLDDAPLQERLAAQPQLVGWMLNTPDIAAARELLLRHGFDPGPAIHASRGDLSWQITVPVQGTPLEGGAIPGLLEWGLLHPSQRLEARGVSLAEVRAYQSPAAAQALSALYPVRLAAAGLEVDFQTPRGALTLKSFCA